MPFFALVSTTERERVLEHVLANPTEKINMNGISRILELSPGQVHKCIAMMRKVGIVRGDRLLQRPITAALRLIFNLRKVEKAKIIEVMRRRIPGCTGIGLFGSWSKGTNRESADLDLWIKMENEPNDANVATVRKEMQRKLGTAVDLVVATASRMTELSEKSPSTFYSLHDGILLWGEPL